MASADKGIRRKGAGWQVFVRVAGQLRTKAFPFDTPRYMLLAWREQQRQAGPPAPTTAGPTLAEDVAGYLARVQAMPTIVERTQHMHLWAAALGPHRSRHDVTAAEIETILQQWQMGNSSRGRRLSPGTARKRRTSLMAFYTKLNGKGGANPVKGASSPKEPAPAPRAIDYTRIEQALAFMATFRYFKNERGPSLSARRARVIAYTGLPPSILMQVQPFDLQLRPSATMPHGSVTLAPRLKGAGVESRTLPLTPAGLAAFQAFHEANAYGAFCTKGLNYAWQAAARRTGLTGTHIYDLRHSFLTQLYRLTRDLATVGRFALHAPGSSATARYALAAHEDVNVAAAQAFGTWDADRRRAAIKTVPGQVAGGESREKLPAKVARLRQHA